MVVGRANKTSFQDGHEPVNTPRPKYKRSSSTISAEYQRPAPSNKLAFITDDQHLQLTRWLIVSGLTYEQIQKKIQQEFGFHVTPYSISRYFLKNVAQYLITRRQRNVDLALQVKGAQPVGEDEFVPLTLDNIKRLAWNLSNDPNCDAKTLKVYYELILRAEDNALKKASIEVKARRISIMESKQKALEDAATDTKLTDAEFSERIRKIFRRDEVTHTNGNGKKVEAPREHTNGFAT